MIVYIRNVCVSFFSSHALFSSLSHSCLSLSCVCVYSQFHCFQCCLLLFLSVGFFFSFPLLLPLVATRLNGRFIGCCSRLVAAFSWFQTFYFVRSLSLSFCVRVFIGFDFFYFQNDSIEVNQCFMRYFSCISLFLSKDRKISFIKATQSLVFSFVERWCKMLGLRW